MSIMGNIFLTLLLLSSVFSTTSSIIRAPSSNIDWWCNRTPHHDPCKHYISQINHHHKINHKSELLLMLVQSALKQVLIMQREAQDFEQNLVTMKHKAVHNDCMKLYENTIFHLNRTIKCLHVKRSCSAADAQTWLSTAHTNIQTCLNGATELGVEDFKVSKLSSNITKMISNSLTINMDFLKQNLQTNRTGTTEAFPDWLSSDDRKLLRSNSSIKADIVVARDGSGQFKNIQDAINEAARREHKTRFIIHVKKGVYTENIDVKSDNENIALVGDGMKNTIITGNRSFKDGFSTYNSATAGIDGFYFIARDITFQNTAGPLKEQAVALRSASDLSVFYRCAIKGYQDTLLVHSNHQFYKQCYIYGTVDFIFGDAAAVFQNCIILARKPTHGQANMITAQGRDDPTKNSGISIINCQIKAAPELKPYLDEYRTFLGRPWQQYARVAVMHTFIDSLVNPLGWSPWNESDYALHTLYYGEYKNYGPGSSTSDRVKWPTFHVITSAEEASQFTATSLLSDRTWLSNSTVPFGSAL